MQSQNQYILKLEYTFLQSQSSTGIEECLKLDFK